MLTFQAWLAAENNYIAFVTLGGNIKQIQKTMTIKYTDLSENILHSNFYIMWGTPYENL